MEFTAHNTLSLIDPDFFDQEADILAQQLLGKILAVKQGEHLLRARVIETEAYYRSEKASHSSLGYTHKRRALFMSPGTIYMYYAHGGDSLNFSARGCGNAVLIKSACPTIATNENQDTLREMQKNNPQKDGTSRPMGKLCSGQTLLCKSLGLKVPDWDGQQLKAGIFELLEDDYTPEKIIKTTRLGIPPGRDENLPLRFIDERFSQNCTKNPLRVRNWQNGTHYTILRP